MDKAVDTRVDPAASVPVECRGWTGRALDDLAQALGVAPVADVALTPEAERLLSHLRQGETAAAIDLCLARPPGLARLHMELFLPILNRLERDWQADAIALADLRFTCLHLHRVVALLGLQRRTLRASGHFGRVLVAVVPGEGHAYGAHVLADMLCDAGWRVDLHEPPDTDTLRDAVQATPYAAVCLSVGHDAALAGLADLVATLRLHAANPRLCVIVGGAGVEAPAAQYHFLGADHVALSATDGLNMLHRLGSAGPGREGI